jgi:threonine/homoserine/homoserine lactone efflux protein
MPDAATLALFLPAMLAITLAPGSDTLYVVATALRGGARRGVVAALGIIAGGCVHIGFATVGLSALIVRSALLFATLKYAGAAYLIYFALRTLRARDEDPVEPSAAPLRKRSIFAQGFLTNALNPKVALFVLAFLPQFVSPARGPVWSQMLVLGALWYAAGLCYFTALALVVGRLRRIGTPSRRLRAGFRYATAAIFVGLGIRVALPESR